MAITRYRLTAERIINALNQSGSFIIEPGDSTFSMITEIARHIEIVTDAAVGTLPATSITYNATTVDAELTSHDSRITSAQNTADNHAHTGVYEPTFVKNTGFNKDFGALAGDVAEGDHNHSGTYEPAFTKETGFNKVLGSGAGQVAEGDHDHAGVYSIDGHDHSGVYEPVFSKNTGFNKVLGVGSGQVAEGDHAHAGTYEPTFSKNTGFNKDLGTITGTVSEGDHTHTGEFAAADHDHDATYLGITAKAADSEKLDDIDSTQFIRSDVADIKTSGSLTFNDNIYTRWGTDGDTEMFHNGTDHYMDLTVGDWYIRDATTTRFTFARTTGDFTATGDVTAYSDEKLKEDIQRIDDALGKVDQLGGYTFTRKDLGTRQTGVIAQEVQKVLPEAVHTAEDGTLSVAYGNMVGLLIEAVKDQQDLIKSLEERLDSIEEKV